MMPTANWPQNNNNNNFSSFFEKKTRKIISMVDPSLKPKKSNIINNVNLLNFLLKN